MRFRNFVLSTALAGTVAAPAAADPLPMDSPVTMGGVETVCTGVGSGKDDPRWASYPIKVEFSNGGAQFLSGAHVKLAGADGKTMAELDCSGPWVLFKLPRGKYNVSAAIQGIGTRSASFDTPASGQKRVEVRYGNAPANQ
jgi:hypothetical protein